MKSIYFLLFLFLFLFSACEKQIPVGAKINIAVTKEDGTPVDEGFVTVAVHKNSFSGGYSIEEKAHLNAFGKAQLLMNFCRDITYFTVSYNRRLVEQTIIGCELKDSRSCYIKSGEYNLEIIVK